MDGNVAHKTGHGSRGGWLMGTDGPRLPPSLHVFEIVHSETFFNFFFYFLLPALNIFLAFHLAFNFLVLFMSKTGGHRTFQRSKVSVCLSTLEPPAGRLTPFHVAGSREQCSVVL